MSKRDVVFHPNRTLKLVGDFQELRPLVGKKTHSHGACDYSGPVGSKICAAEGGRLFYYAGFREEKTLWAPDEITELPFKNYFYDTYGGIAILVGDSGRTYLYCHLYMNQIFNNYGVNEKWTYIEERAEKRFPKHAFLSSTRIVHPGEIICGVGNAGYSLGPHLHLEIHPTFKWYKYEDRVDPEILFKEI